ncbi:hypothetical protein [Polaromonas sp.]|nr:hypothetical protein [Polaromonas sp.]
MLENKGLELEEALAFFSTFFRGTGMMAARLKTSSLFPDPVRENL